MSILRILAVTALTLAAAGSWACGDWLPKHGGIMNQGGETSFELVAKGRELLLHLEDHGTPIPVEGSRAMLHVEGAGGAWSAPLQPLADNVLRTVMPQELLPGDRILARVMLADGSIVGGRFVFAMETPKSLPAPTAATTPFRFR